MPFLRRMEIGDNVMYLGRRYVLRGLDPMSVDERRALLEDALTGERIWVPLADLPDDSGTSGSVSA
jgi:hypothetical protein